MRPVLQTSVVKTTVVTLTVAFGWLCSATQVLAATKPSTAQLVAADQRFETQLCISAAADPLHQFKHKAANHHAKLAMLASKLRCNDVPLARFAQQWGNDRVAHTLSRYTKGHVDIEILSQQADRVSGSVSP